jgi:hypothetical protein
LCGQFLELAFLPVQRGQDFPSFQRNSVRQLGGGLAGGFGGSAEAVHAVGQESGIGERLPHLWLVGQLVNQKLGLPAHQEGQTL